MPAILFGRRRARIPCASITSCGLPRRWNAPRSCKNSLENVVKQSHPVVNLRGISTTATDGGGTLVTEEFELDDIPAMRLYRRTLGWLRGPPMVKDMGRALLAHKRRRKPGASVRSTD